MDLKEKGAKLKELLGLEGSAVAVKLAKSKDEIPAGYEELGEEKRHCEMIQIARKEGKKFYATKEKHSCKGGAYAIGVVQDAPEPLKTGKLYHKLGNFATEEGAVKTVGAIPRVKEEMYASVYAPLEDADFTPDSIVVICTPKQGLRLTQALLYKNGGRFQADFSGIQSLCADAVAAVKVRGVANATLGCNGSRKYAEIADEEVVFAFPVDDLDNVIEALEHFKEIWG
ncbi:DUF169 domain-containing protein [Methanotorris formicicus]|uniref:DUF169 domain-containing protein n=1 Tax=Methanotorris formicicus Mc-S-70 TaxID=647171 RepID=H1L1M3_9EURY|nr:DUF169 domain-containing protein [Methanotorris formicicus]EHP83606.1 protein of unknown function DUF169 [Methanotorris formicicus Mc-S-70]